MPLKNIVAHQIQTTPQNPIFQAPSTTHLKLKNLRSAVTCPNGEDQDVDGISSPFVFITMPGQLLVKRAGKTQFSFHNNNSIYHERQYDIRRGVRLF